MKRIFFFLFLLLGISLKIEAQEPVHIQFGNGKYSLKDFFTTEEMESLKKLKVSGYLDYYNLKEITSLATLFRPCPTCWEVKGSLEYLDLSEACYASTAHDGGVDIFPHENGFNMFHVESNYTTLKTLLLPSCLKDLGVTSFQKLHNLESIVLPNKLEEINCFSGFEKLVSVVLPNSLKRLNDYCFENCYSLTSIVIPSMVTQQAHSVFKNCSNLTTVTYEGSVFSGNNVFEGCTSLKEIHVKSKIPTVLKENPFREIQSQATLYVPKDCLDIYKTSPIWCNFTKIEEEETNPTGIEIMDTQKISIQTNSDGIEIYSNLEVPIFIYTINGKLVSHELILGHKQISLSKGFYIVVADNYSQKVIINE